MNVFGDSVAGGTGSSGAPSKWTTLLSSATGLSLSVHSVSGDVSADGAAAVYAASGESVLAYGINDARTHHPMRSGLQALAAWLALDTKQLAVSSGSYTGSWSNTYAYGIGKRSTTNGDTATFSVSGDVIYIGYIQQDVSNGEFSVEVDDVSCGTFSNNEDIDTENGITYSPALARIKTSPGSHEVKITVTSSTGSGNIVYIDWVAGNDQSSFPTVLVSNILRMTQTAYSLYGSSDGNVFDYNKQIAGLVNELNEDGLDVRLVDVCSKIGTADLYSDGVHPVDSGHAKIAAAFFSTLLEK